MEDKPITSANDTEVIEKETTNVNFDKINNKSKNDKKMKKDEPKRKSWFSLAIFNKKSVSPKSSKKMCKKSKSLSTDDTSSISSARDEKSASETNITLNDDDDALTKTDECAVPTPPPNSGGKTTGSGKKDVKQTTVDVGETTPPEDGKTPDRSDDKVATPDESLTVDSKYAVDSTSDDEDIVAEILDESARSVVVNDDVVDVKSTADGHAEAVELITSGPNVDIESDGNTCAPVVSFDSPDDYTNNYNTEDVRATDELTAVTEGAIGGDKTELNVDDNEYDKMMERRLAVLHELVETEKAYVQDLSLVVDKIMVALEDPESIGCDVPIPNELVRSEKDELISNNIKQIYEWHRDVFLSEVKKCLGQPLLLSQLFKKYEREFGMYVDYSQKITTLECISLKYDDYFEELRMSLDHVMKFSDLLFKPVLRLMSYLQLLREMINISEQVDLDHEVRSLRQAVCVIEIVMKQICDAKAIGRLKNFQGDVADQGKLLMHGVLTCTGLLNGGDATDKKVKGELQVFLFERVMVFSKESDERTDVDDHAYVYVAHIQVDDMVLDEPDSADGTFVVKSPTMAFSCHAVGDKSQSEWLHAIRGLLQSYRGIVWGAASELVTGGQPSVTARETEIDSAAAH